jgi:hypothetical protein
MKPVGIGCIRLRLVQRNQTVWTIGTKPGLTIADSLVKTKTLRPGMSDAQ